MERLCFPGKECTIYEWRLFEEASLYVSGSLSATVGVGMTSWSSALDKQPRTHNDGVGALEPGSSVNMCSSKALISPLCRGENEAPLSFIPAMK